MHEGCFIVLGSELKNLLKVNWNISSLVIGMVNCWIFWLAIIYKGFCINIHHRAINLWFAFEDERLFSSY